MSEDQLYELANQRVARRNRRRTFWALDLGGLTLSLALVALIESPVTAALFLAWGGIFTVHTILMVMANSHERDIEREVVKLRQVADAYEKPKRHLELSDDGELTELVEERGDAERMKRN